MNDSHKGDYGHLCLICGCDSMPGAAALATAAALKSGCGLVTLHTSPFAAQICAVSNPSAILSLDKMPFFSETGKDWTRYTAVAAGPGLGKDRMTAPALGRMLESRRDAGQTVILDADALNLIAADPGMEALIPEGSVLTPHDGELARLSPWASEGKERAARSLADRTGCIVVSKGFHTRIYAAGKDECYENTTGNPGMAKGGSGDVLTGLIGGLAARGYDNLTAAALGVWIHGFAGDRCSRIFGMESFSSSDLAAALHHGFLELLIP